MARIDLVREYVEKRFADNLNRPDACGVEAGEVASALGIWRNDASADLKRLYEMGLLQKCGKRPVLYYPAGAVTPQSEGTPGGEDDQKAPRPMSAFSNIVGADGSLKNLVQTAKAAAMYPPNGLHMLISGESGVGKSMFAEEVWRFINEFRGSEEHPVPFVVFNCAEYADNPQLLQSHLFGHVKGAFTGAVADKQGLVEDAAGGVLFLDEIHRLPPVGQEMFFTLIDKGIFRRLGDTAAREAHLMIIGATTEEITSVMLRSFRRRMPVQIQLPMLAERPLSERIALIHNFLNQEANRVNCPIFLTGPACRSITLWQSKANIGDLKNLLQLCCAKNYCAYLMSTRQESSRQPLLKIDLCELPFQNEGLEENGPDGPDLSPVSQVFQEGILAVPRTDPEFHMPYEDCNQSIDLYGFVKKQLKLYQMQNLPRIEIEQRISRDLEAYYGNALKKLPALDESGREPLPFQNVVSQEAADGASELLTLASVHFNRSYPKSVRAILALHLQQFIERSRVGYVGLDTDFSGAEPRYEDEISFIRSILPHITHMLNTTVPEDELRLLAMFIRHPDENFLQRIGIVVAAHGESTATSIVGFARQLLSVNYAVAVDIPVDKSAADMLENLCRAVRTGDAGHGVILMVDTEDFLAVQQEIIQRTGIQCRIVPSVNTPLVLETIKQVFSGSEELDALYTRLKNRYREYINVLFVDDAEKPPADREIPGDENLVVLTICATGMGSAKMLSDFLYKHLTFRRQVDIRPISVNENGAEIAAGLGNRLRAVVGSFRIPGLDVPFFSTETILMGNGLKQLDALLRLDMARAQPDRASLSLRDYALSRVRTQIKHFAPSYDGEQVIAAATSIADQVGASILRRPVTVDVLVRVILHLGSLLERMKVGEVAGMPEWGAEWKAARGKELEQLRAIIDGALQPFSYQIPEAELLYFMQIL
ncbi:sigma 54-interacting transcriptional regulator [Intestinimonas massiliensis (ex Afouda et al. 2020)]|uniref:sigma 54-interacting transcriptional regulator n=1 Tax=Intestinimonas massiliensis (ex Afouda et al. 2020) TaxID=1673721 RepID=UPI0013EF586B|nr:sigma 54-interacting transcriptional regulator [Intestinimonas massiliensis (ex Afouda et al. 2020)]